MNDETEFGFGILNEGTVIGIDTSIRLCGCCSTMLIDFDREEVDGDHEAFVRLVTIWPHLLKDPKSSS